MRVFYEVKVTGCIAKGNACCPQIAHAALLAQPCADLRAFIAMKLQQGVGNSVQCCIYLLLAGVHKEQHRCDQGRQTIDQPARLCQAHGAWALG